MDCRKSTTIILINRNGGELLYRSLTSLRDEVNSVAARNDIELVVVDNDSSDESVEIIAAVLVDASFTWRLIVERVPGVNAARNAGVRAASGELLIFVDSDITFRKGWLAGYLDAAVAHPHKEVFAGRVLVGSVEGDVPSWLDLTGVYARPSVVVQADFGSQQLVMPLEGGRGPVGPNMAMRRSLLERVGLFDTRFGLRRGSLVAGGEAEFFHRVGRSKAEFVYVPDACVYHPLRRDQMSKRYFRRRLNGVGRVLARIQRLDRLNVKRLFGVKRYLYGQLLMSWIYYLATLCGSSVKRRFFRRCEISIIWGQIQEDIAASYHAALHQ